MLRRCVRFGPARSGIGPPLACALVVALGLLTPIGSRGDELALGSPRPAANRVWTDVYAESFGWSRASGASRDPDVVPTLRLRGLYALAPELGLDLHAYFGVQITRDVASHAAGVLSTIYADDRAIMAPGLLLRAWSGRVGLFAQAGAAVDLLGKAGTRFDARAGAFLGIESQRCWAHAGSGVELRIDPCAEVYSEAVYLSRFQDDVVGFARGRLGASYLVTGPVSWGLVAQVRTGASRNQSYWDNYVDGGAGVRWRLLAPFHADLLATVDRGTYYGVAARDPAPSPLAYTELRLLFSTYLEYRP